MINDEKKTLLISRYLIENSSDKFLELDFDSSALLAQVKVKFKKLLGNIRHYSENEEKELRENLSKVKYVKKIKKKKKFKIQRSSKRIMML